MSAYNGAYSSESTNMGSGGSKVRRERLTACNAIPSAARPSSCKHRDVAIERAARCLGDSIRCGAPLLTPRKQYDDDTHRMPQLSLTTPTTKAQQVSPTSPV